MTVAVPLVSVALATHNGEKFLRQQLNSIYAQTYPNVEVVVSDDRSTDGTVAILEEYRRSHGLAYRVNETNLGYPKNFEKAASLCNGAYIAFSDQDDIFLPDKIETLVHEIGGYSLIYSDATLIDEEGTVFAPSYMRYVNFPMLTGKPFKELVFSCFIRGFQVLFTRELLRAALPMPERVTHDDWFTILAAKRDGIKYLDRPLVHYRQHGRNVTGSLVRFSALREFAAVVRNFANRQANEGRKKYYGAILEKLDSLHASPVFDDGERQFIAAVSTYYRNQVDSVIHWRSFLIALRNFGVIAPQRSPMLKTKFLLASLIHQ
jgi:glycosyltransferase involved in cell wall biosynthesis